MNLKATSSQTSSPSLPPKKYQSDICNTFNAANTVRIQQFKSRSQVTKIVEANDTLENKRSLHQPWQKHYFNQLQRVKNITWSHLKKRTKLWMSDGIKKGNMNVNKVQCTWIPSILSSFPRSIKSCLSLASTTEWTGVSQTHCAFTAGAL